MARQQKRLSALQVKNLSKPGLYGDGGGLTLQITARGSQSWLFRYMVTGKPYAMGLGPTQTVTLAEARQKALDARKLLRDGINPLVAKKHKESTDAVECAVASSLCGAGPPPAVIAPARIQHAGKAICKTYWQPSTSRAGQNTIHRSLGSG